MGKPIAKTLVNRLHQMQVVHKWWIQSWVKDPKKMRFELRKNINGIKQKSVKCALIQRKLIDRESLDNTNLFSHSK